MIQRDKRIWKNKEKSRLWRRRLL